MSSASVLTFLPPGDSHNSLTVLLETRLNELPGRLPLYSSPLKTLSKVKSSYFTTDGRSVSQSVSQYVLVSSPLWDLRPNITSCTRVAVLSLWSALSDERTGLQFAVQSLNGPSRAELHCLISDSPNVEGQVPVFISPSHTPRPLGS
jgi:hypothetical protein